MTEKKGKLAAKWDLRVVLVFFLSGVGVGVGVVSVFTGQALSSKRASSLLHQLVLCFFLKAHRLKKSMNRVLCSLSHKKHQFRGKKKIQNQNPQKEKQKTWTEKVL